jgi:hypothetical protein
MIKINIGSFTAMMCDQTSATANRNLQTLRQRAHLFTYAYVFTLAVSGSRRGSLTTAEVQLLGDLGLGLSGTIQKPSYFT